MELLVARSKGGHQEICPRLFQVSTKQSLAPKEVGEIIPIRYSTRTMAED